MEHGNVLLIERLVQHEQLIETDARAQGKRRPEDLGHEHGLRPGGGAARTYPAVNGQQHVGDRPRDHHMAPLFGIGGPRLRGASIHNDAHIPGFVAVTSQQEAQLPALPPPAVDEVDMDRVQ